MQFDNSYSYNVRISANADVLKSGELAERLPNCGEVLVVSKKFDTYDNCESALSALLSSLTKSTTQISKKNHVVVTMLNPTLNGKEIKEGEEWEVSVLLKAYIADAEALKKSFLTTHVVGQIRLEPAEIPTFTMQ